MIISIRTWSIQVQLAPHNKNMEQLGSVGPIQSKHGVIRFSWPHTIRTQRIQVQLVPHNQNMEYLGSVGSTQSEHGVFRFRWPHPIRSWSIQVQMAPHNQNMEYLGSVGPTPLFVMPPPSPVPFPPLSILRITCSVTEKPTPGAVFNLQASDLVHCELKQVRIEV